MSKQNSTSNCGHVAMSTEDRKAFWLEYQAWLPKASTEELEQLHAALDSFVTNEVVGLSRVIREALLDEHRRRQLPSTLVEQLEVLNWPGARANG